MRVIFQLLKPDLHLCNVLRLSPLYLFRLCIVGKAGLNRENAAVLTAFTTLAEGGDGSVVIPNASITPGKHPSPSYCKLLLSSHPHAMVH